MFATRVAKATILGHEVQVSREDAAEAVDGTHVRGGDHQVLGLLGQELHSLVQGVLEQGLQVPAPTLWQVPRQPGQPGLYIRHPAQVCRVLWSN